MYLATTRLKIVRTLSVHMVSRHLVVTIIRYIPLSGLNFAVYTGQYQSYMPSSPWGLQALDIIGKNGVFVPLVHLFWSSQREACGVRQKLMLGGQILFLKHIKWIHYV